MSILDLLSISDEYDLRDLITNVPELTIDSQDEMVSIELAGSLCLGKAESGSFLVW